LFGLVEGRDRDAPSAKACLPARNFNTLVSLDVRSKRDPESVCSLLHRGKIPLKDVQIEEQGGRWKFVNSHVVLVEKKSVQFFV
jgi:hypothetical protein